MTQAGENESPALVDRETSSHRARLEGTFTLEPADLAPRIAAERDRLAARGFAAALWARRPEAWSAAPDVQAKIANRLGWLTSPDLMAGALPRLRRFAEDVRHSGFTHVVLIGMGGSSLAPEVLRAILGPASGWPAFRMIDSVDPDVVRAIDPPAGTTLFLFASKSGGTIEPNVLAAHYRSRVEAAGDGDWARHFVAITDEGTALHQRAAREGFREIFLNPADIGGRYSALSYFGLVPAALMGLDLVALVASARAMAAACAADVPVDRNPGLGLGVALGAAARAGRDKLTLVLPDRFEPLGLWIEQLVAESTGKQGVGIVPIAGEALADPESYSDDRFFVRLRVASDPRERERDAQADRLRAARIPIADISAAGPDALGAEFMRWEIATATAGAVLEINPFDEPNVQQAKDATRALLERYARDGRLPEAGGDMAIAGATLRLSAAARDALGAHPADRFLRVLHERDYLGVMAYLEPGAAIVEPLRALRETVRRRARPATMFGYGPRYLHSTGQLHKGGPNTGVFVIVSAEPSPDLAIPGENFSFGVLERAQALGDFASLDATGRRALHVHLPRRDLSIVGAVCDALVAGMD